MHPTPHLPCDGCGQLAGVAHISRRLQRLEWATRFRPIHIHALLLGGIAPQNDDEFLYSPHSTKQGEARIILDALQLSIHGQSPDDLLSEFQKLGLMLAHVLECPLEPNVSASDAQALLEKQLPATISRIRRSLKPKRVLLFSPDLSPLAAEISQSNLGCPVILVSPANDLPAFRSALG